MERKRTITQPLGKQSADFLTWRESLRSIKGPYFSETVPTLRRSNSASNLRKSTGNLAANFSSMSGKTSRTSTDLENIEAEYIKNLQQQVYFLELEANYLREQAKKATDMHPQMSVEAERMLNKLRQMQSEVDGLHLEMKRKESTVDMMSTEKERLISRLKQEEDGHQREKRLLLDEVVQLKKEKDLMERDNARKDTQILQAREELEKATTALKSGETKIQILRNQVEQKTEQYRMTQSALEEKRGELMKLETQLREVEEKYYSSSATLQDKLVDDLREEIRMLRQKMKEAELNLDQDRYLRNKLTDDSSHLVKENALLNQQVIELQRQVERERGLREDKETRQSQSITDFVLMKDREQQVRYELEQAKEMLKLEQDRCKHYLSQLAKQEQVSTSMELNSNTTRSKLVELEGMHQSTDVENSQLRRDKMLLVDHVADIQKQLEEKEKEILQLRSHIHSTDSRLKELEHLKDIESSLHSQKWEEFSRLADSMKTLSRTMAKTGGSPASTNRGSQLLEFS